MFKSIKPSDYSSYRSQKRYLQYVKRTKKNRVIETLGMKLSVFPKSYEPKGDSELMARTVKINKKQIFLEIGTGCGMVTLYLSRKAKKGLATDINPYAIRNAKYNAKMLGIKNVTFAISDVFSRVKGKYDILIFNPPYSNHKAKDLTDRIFWDTNNEAKVKFFKQVKYHLNPNGRIYFGWADFKDLDINLPLRLISGEGFHITKVVAKDHGKFKFYVFESKASAPPKE